MAEELGRERLGPPVIAPFQQCCDFLTKASWEEALDLIELTFRVIDLDIRKTDASWAHYAKRKPDDAIAYLNHRLREHGIGYEYIQGKLVHRESGYVHDEAVKPALLLLKEEDFSGAEEEFLKAHEYYRKGEYKDANTWALKAFESTIKTICDQRKWSYTPNDTAKKLIDIIFSHELIPSYLSSQFNGIRATLESGLPTIRNRTSGHGQGPTVVAVPQHLAAYALHLCASSIVFLIRAHKAPRSEEAAAGQPLV